MRRAFLTTLAVSLLALGLALGIRTGASARGPGYCKHHTCTTQPPTTSSTTGATTTQPTTAPVTTTVTTTPPPPPLNLFGADFESGICPPFDNCDNGGGGIVRRVTSPVAQGTSALEETVTPTAKASNATAWDAVWVYNNAKPYEGGNGQTNTYHVRVRFPTGFQAPYGNYNWFVEHHNNGGYSQFSCQQEYAEFSLGVLNYSDGVNLWLRVMGGPTCSPSTTWYKLGALQLEHWYDLQYAVAWSSSAGSLKLSLDGAQLVDYAGPTLYRRPDGASDDTNYELVNYRAHASWDATIYFDDSWVK